MWKGGSQTLYMEGDYIIYHPIQDIFKSEKGAINNNRMSVTLITRMRWQQREMAFLRVPEITMMRRSVKFTFVSN